ncbi:DUF2179 domain-containing protein [Paenibacillus eucommiae]|uniref:UPF0316 protein J2Z66_000433 n=1 Tax=Paenibacillus eucommiae TaxID=1355755 RepID=A0ABS4IMN5_9BACL|nr:DUF2179 domain-containing protein [Paenibacillus eucommiae]MBP1988838.1 uncharacterized protein YebE (UPF0316 family) [Paenibacillus eucommiae]
MQIVTLLLIFAINITYVAINTLRVILVIKRYRVLASVLSTVEVLIYLVGLNIVLQDITNIVNLIVYCIGWGSGIYVGSRIEQLLALGYSSFQIITSSSASPLLDELRRRGFAVTSWMADGRDGPRLMMYALVRRKREAELKRTVEEIEPKAFIVSYDPGSIGNGYHIANGSKLL